jgi:hypothetical protein
MLARPVVLTVLAAILIAIAVVHAREPAPSPPCQSADSLRSHGFLSEARAVYLSLLKGTPPPRCAGAGLDDVSKQECQLAKQLASTSPADAAKLYRAVATVEPARPSAACARAGLAELPAEAKLNTGR